MTETTCCRAADDRPGRRLLCSFRANVAGDAGASVTDVVTATARDLRNNLLTDDDDAVVTITDVKPLLQVDKSVSPSVVAEPGGTVNYTVVVTNPSKEELTLTTLSDDKFGSLAGKGTARFLRRSRRGPTTRAPSAAEVKGDPSTPHINTVTGTANDNENNAVTDTGAATVDVHRRPTDARGRQVGQPVGVARARRQGPVHGGRHEPAGAAEHIDLTSLQDDTGSAT